VGGGIAGGIGKNKFMTSLYAHATATPMIQAGNLSHFAVHFTANVSKNTVLAVEKNGVSYDDYLHGREKHQHLR
jgi:hypothetical protein